jgi:hypothetical protein
MAITFPTILPTVTGIRSITLRARNVTARSGSPFTLKQQIVSHPGQRWEAEVSLPPMARAAGEEWVSFMVAQYGGAGTFLMGDPLGATPRGVGGGTPVINGAGQTGGSISVGGGPNSQTGWLLMGDYIQLGTGATTTLHKVLTDANTSAGGVATLDVWPWLRTAPADGAAVVVSNAVGRWRMATSEAEWDVSTMRTYGITFAAIEALT